MSGSATAERRSVRAQSEGVELPAEEATAPEQPAPEGIPVPDSEPAGEPAPQPASPARPEPEPMPDPVSVAPDGTLVRWTPEGWLPLGRPRPAGSVWEAVSRVQSRVGAIPKTGTNTDQGYSFRGIDQVYEALHGICAEEGLVILPQATPEMRPEVRQTKNGSSLYATRVLVRFELVGPDGSSRHAAAWGEGADTSDKATQKAHSQAVKSALLSLFLIPTEESREQEPDASSPEGRPFSEQEVNRGYTALQAAKDAQTIEALAAVRRRALSGGLLPVPLQEEDGTVAALTYWIDQRRAVLEAAAQQPGGEG